MPDQLFVQRARIWVKAGASRRFLALGVLLVPSLTALAVDVSRRGERLLEFSWLHTLYYALALLQSVLLWGLLLFAAAQRSVHGLLAAALFVLGVTFTLGGQVYFFEQYSAYLTRDLTLFASNLLGSAVNQLGADAENYLSTKLPFALLAGALVWFVRSSFAAEHLKLRAAKHQRLTPWAPALLLVACFLPTHYRSEQAAPPDTLYLNALGGFARSQLGLSEEGRSLRPGLRHSIAVPALRAAPTPPRNLVFVITESARADVVCSAYDPACRSTPHTNALLPGRHALLQHRALSSTTAISLAVLLAGISPGESSEVMHGSPLLFDYARAAGWFTAYWTSQNLFFANSRLFVKNLGVDRTVSGTQLDGEADIDMGADEALLATHVEREISSLREPFLAVLHTSNVHFPYLVDESGPQPFQPARLSKRPEHRAELFNHYKNAIARHDRELARALGAIRRSALGERTIIVYTSDHGEAFAEHGQSGHTFSMFDEEVKVPAFVDAPPGTLSDAERLHLREHEERFTFHPDLSVTLLDLMGLWDAPELAPFKAKIIGQSLIRPPASPSILPMTNCAAVWSCAFENWGVMRAELKLFGRTPFSEGWACYDVTEDPLELQPLGSPQCDVLKAETLRHFHRPPR